MSTSTTQKLIIENNRDFDYSCDRGSVFDAAQEALAEQINYCPENYDKAERDPEVIGRKSREFAAMFADCWDIAMKNHMAMVNHQSAK